MNMYTPWETILLIRQIVSKKRKKQFYFLITISIFSAFIEIFNLSILDILLKKTISRSETVDYIQNSSNEILNKIFLLQPRYVLVVLLIFLSLGLIFRLTSLTLQYKYTAYIGSDLAKSCFFTILNKPYQWHTSNNSSSTITLLTKDTDQFTIFVQECLAFLVNITLVTIISIWMIQYSITYFSSIIAIFLTVLYSIYLYNKVPLRENGEIYSLTNQSNIKIVQESLGSIREIFVKNSFKLHFDKFKENYLKYRISIAQITTRVQAPRSIIETLIIFFITLLFVLFSSTTKGKYIDFTITGTLLFGMLKLLQPLQNCFNSINNLYAVQPSVSKVFKTLNSNTIRDQMNNNLKVVKFNSFDSVVVELVDFKYQTMDDLIIKQASLTINKGDKIGIIGKTGSGKSTLVDIMMGLLEPSSGKVIIDGNNLYSREEIRNGWLHSLSCVSQNIFLRDTSIAENIAYGVDSRDVDLCKVKYVSKLACIDEFIEKLKNGYDTQVGERGLLLSGGQRQRIAIASALYNDSNIIIFDEATSALDAKTEKNVIDAIEREKHDVTFIFITHRINTLASCNKIYTIKDGKVSNPISFNEIKDSINH